AAGLPGPPVHRALAWRISHGAWADFSRVPAACARQSRTPGIEPGPRAAVAGKRIVRGEPHAAARPPVVRKQTATRPTPRARLLACRTGRAIRVSRRYASGFAAGGCCVGAGFLRLREQLRLTYPLGGDLPAGLS